MDKIAKKKKIKGADPPTAWYSVVKRLRIA